MAWVSPEFMGESRALTNEELRKIALIENEKLKKMSEEEKKRILEEYEKNKNK